MVATRGAQIILMIWAVATALFIVLNVVPGGPVLALSGEFADADTVARIEARLGLDRPLWVRYWNFLSLLAVGDLSESYTYSRPVTGIVLEHIPATAILALPAIVMAAAIGIPLGIYSARSSLLAPVIIGLALVLFAIPVFWLGHVLRILPGISQILPAQGMTDARAVHTGAALWFDVFCHALLPVATLTLHQMAFTTVMTRRAVKTQMQRQYITTAFSKGLTRSRVEWVHAFPNGAAPIIALFGNRIGWFLSGAILVEVTFAWPGLGQLTLAAIQNRDTPLVIGIVLFGTILTMLGNLAAEIAQDALDPRVRNAGT